MTLFVMTSRSFASNRVSSVLKLNMLMLRCCPGDANNFSDVIDGHFRAISLDDSVMDLDWILICCDEQTVLAISKTKF